MDSSSQLISMACAIWVLHRCSRYSHPRRTPQRRRRPSRRPSPWVGGRRGLAGKNHTNAYTLSRESMGQNADMGEIFGDSFVDLNVKASHGCHSARRADPSTPGGSGVDGEHPGEGTARKDGQRQHERSADQKRIGAG